MPFGQRTGALVSAFGPRRLRTARATLAGVVCAGTLAHLGVTLVRAQGPTWVDITACGLLLGLAVALLLVPDGPAGALCVLLHLVGVAITVLLDLLSRDASVVGQVFFYLPVVSAATQLRVPGAILVTAAAVAGEAVVVMTLLPAAEAWTDLAFVGTTLVTSAVVLARAGVLEDRLVAQLERQAALDPLTGLLTRRVLDEETAGAVARARAGATRGAGFVLLDVDRFKLVNDEHGHAAGDDALVHIAGLIERNSGSGAVVARMGGDELAVLLPDCPYVEALRTAHDLVDAVRAAPLRLPDGTEVPLSISVGAAHVPDHAATARCLYACADEALYEVKRGGRGRAGRAAPPRRPAQVPQGAGAGAGPAG